MLTLSVSLFAQKTFHKSFGEQGDDGSVSVCEDADMNVYLVGSTKSFGSREIYLVKIDSLGNMLWSRSLSGAEGIDKGNAIRFTEDGNLIVAGITTGAGGGRKDAVLIKLNLDGNVLWSKTYGEERDDYFFDVKTTLDGGFIAVGETNSFGAQSSDIFIVKTDKDGNVRWSKILGGHNVEYGYSVEETFDGFVVASETNSYGAGGWDVSLVKLDKKGNKQWYKTYGGDKDDYGYCISNTDDDGIVMVGSTVSFGMGQRDMYIFKLDKKGNKVIAKTLGELGYDQAHGVIQTEDKGFLITGFTNSYSQQQNVEDMLVLRLASNFNAKWAKTIGGQFSDYGLGLIQSANGDYLITGETYSYNGRDDKDAYFVRVNDVAGAKEICEQSRVQVIGIKLKDEFIVEDPEGKLSNIVLEGVPYVLENHERLSFENIICIDNMNILTSERVK